jgi:hypothetical protein
MRAARLLILLAWPTISAGATDDGPEARALRFLAREVPIWSRENGCYSCHNNGDAARALFLAARTPGLEVPRQSLDDTTAWLSRPEGWDRNGGEGGPSDKRLARVQFASALAEAVASGLVTDRGPLRRAADWLVDDQAPDGSWPIEGDDAGLVGSPATYGGLLATVAARDVLRAANPARYKGPIVRAESWLLLRPVRNVLDAATILMVLDGAIAPPDGSDEARRRALALLREGQSDSGGWGPFAGSQPEPFDTAVALLALVRSGDDPEARAMIRRGRAWLIASQRDDGSWPETTRPPGGESYAQRLSTAGWATRALLATRAIAPD